MSEQMIDNPDHIESIHELASAAKRGSPALIPIALALLEVPIDTWIKVVTLAYLFLMFVHYLFVVYRDIKHKSDGDSK